MKKNKYISKVIPDLSLLRLSKKVGKQPGVVEYVGEHIVETQISHLSYNSDHIRHKNQTDPTQVKLDCQSDSVHWIDVFGLSSVDKVKALCDLFEIHPLIQEDIADVEQLPKSEQFSNHYFVTLKMLSLDPIDKSILKEHVSLILGENYVFSFQEKPGDVFNELRDRIHHSVGKLRHSGADYLFCRLIDAVVDQYFAVFEKVRSDIERLELDLLEKKGGDQSDQIISIRKNIIQLRKMVMPLREALARIKRSDTKLIKREWLHYLDDTSDQLEHVISSFDSFRDMLSYLMDLNFANLTNQTNEIVKTLTVISAIFIPLTFLAGVYGMNFVNMPELKTENGYYVLLGVMALILVASLIATKRRKWW